MMRESGRCEIDNMEWEETAYRLSLSHDQALLYLLKQKGAPVLGSIIYTPDKSYLWTRRDNHRSNTIIFNWSPYAEEGDNNVKTKE